MPKHVPISADAAAPPRITAISYSLAPSHSFSSTATYRYPDGSMRPVSVRLDAHRYDLMVASQVAQGNPAAGPAEVAAALHDLYYCLYAPRPQGVASVPETGSIPDRP